MTVPDWSGRLVVDVTNQFAGYQPTYSGFVDLGEETGSEWVARHLPGASVVKAFNIPYASYIAADPRHAAGHGSGDVDLAKRSGQRCGFR